MYRKSVYYIACIWFFGIFLGFLEEGEGDLAYRTER